MSQQNGFSSGFVIGSIVGGVVGGILGTLLATKNDNKSSTNEDNSLLQAGSKPQFSTEQSIEEARHSLEDKIAQLNLAIDDVRQQLGSVNSKSVESD